MRLSAILLGAWIAGCAADVDADVGIISADNAPEFLKQCSRPTPKAQSFWTPDPAAVAAAEAGLNQITDLRPSIAAPNRYLRQYVGIVIAGKRLLYLNAIGDRRLVESPTEYIMICDGGEGFWGAIFDPETKQYSDLRSNGVG